MGSYLKNVDIHEFLASIGKHAIEKATHGFSDVRSVKPKCSKIIFVEDIDELEHCDNGCSIGDKEDKGFACGGWRESTHKDNTSGWGAKKNVTAHECKENYDNSGWGEEIEANPSGWESSTQKESKSGWEMKESSDGGWDKSTHLEDNARWGEEKKVAPAEWGKGTQRGESCTGWGSSTQREGNAGWGDKSRHQEDNAGWGEEKKVAPAEWGKGAQRGESCTRWGSSTQREGNAGWGDKKHANAGRGRGNKVASGEWGKGGRQEDNAGWEDEKYVARGGWGKGTQEERTSTGWRSHNIQEDRWGKGTQEHTSTGWRRGNIQKDGWGEEKVVPDDGWGKEKTVASGGWGRGTQKEDTRIGWGSSLQKEANVGFGEEKKVTAGGWEEERKVVSARWGKDLQREDTRVRWGSSTQKRGTAGWEEAKEVAADGWGQNTQHKADDGWGEERDVAPGGWGSSAQKKGTAGWEEAKEVIADGCGQSTQQKVDDGWGEEKEVPAGGWGEEKDVALGGWGKGAQEDTHCGGESSTQKKGTAGWEEAKEVTANGWGQNTQQKVDDGWGEEKEVTAGGWGEEEDVAPGGWGRGAREDTRSGGGSSTRKKATAGWKEAKEVTADGRGESTQQKVHYGWGAEKEVTAGGWGEEKDVAPGGWGKGAQDDTHSRGRSSTQKEGTAGHEAAKEVIADGWGQSTQQKVDDGWGEMEDDSGVPGGWGENTRKEDNSVWGSAQNVPTRNTDALRNSDWAKADDPSLDCRGGGKQKFITGDTNGWDHPFKSDSWKTDSADGWDSMWGQNPRNRPKKGWSTRSVDPLVSTESRGADERRSGTFGPSGTNMVPLGKRKSFLKACSGNAEKGHDKSDWAPELERCSDLTNQFVANGRIIRESVPESETPSAKVRGMRMESEEDCWANSEQSQPLWKNLGRSDLNSQVDGWNDTSPDAQDDTVRPNKRFNRCFTGKPWTGPASNGPHSQSRWPQLKALIQLPEYSELGELYKATNKILHYNGYQPGDKLNPEDEKFVLEKILVHHRDKESKLGCGVEYVMIDSHSDHQVSCFWVVRKDGSKIDFSYWKCLENLFETKYALVEMEVHKVGKDCWGMGTKSAAPFRRRHPQEADKDEAKDGW